MKESVTRIPTIRKAKQRTTKMIDVAEGWNATREIEQC